MIIQIGQQRYSTTGIDTVTVHRLNGEVQLIDAKNTEMIYLNAEQIVSVLATKKEK